MQSTSQAEAFYQTVLDVLIQAGIPFMVGGTYGFCAYADMTRASKDLDIFVTKKDHKKILTLLRKADFATELLDPMWIGKVYHEEAFVDIIFAERHGLYSVDTTWLTHAHKKTVLGRKVLLMPLEQIIRTKCYVEFRDKYDGSDIAILLLLYGKELDWQWLVDSIDKHWQLLFAHLLNFTFIFPRERNSIPHWVIQKYTKATEDLFATPVNKKKITKGLLISYEYAIAIEKWGYKADET